MSSSNHTTLPPIFIISLPNSPRRKDIAHRLNWLGIPFQFFDATDGRTLSETELSQVDYHFFPNRFSVERKLTLGEIGCAISHIRVYQHIKQNNIPEAIILEDDAMLHHHFIKIFSILKQKLPKKAQIVFLAHGKAKYWPIKKSLPEGYHLVRYRYPSSNSKRFIAGACAYLITQDAADILLTHANPIKLPADYLTGAIQINRLIAYGVEPSCVFLSATPSEIDTIEPRQ